MTETGIYVGSDGHLTEMGVALYVDALKLELAERLPADVRSHVEECSACKKDITGVFALMQGEDLSGVLRHPLLGKVQVKEAGRFRTLYRIAAVITALLGVGVIAYFLVLHHPAAPVGLTAEKGSGAVLDSAGGRGVGGKLAEPPAQTAAPTGGAPHPSAEDLAANFQGSPELEDLVGDHIRSEEIRVLTPANGTQAGGKITFGWEPSAGHSMKLSILNNRAEPVFRRRVEGGSYLFRNVLPPGLYYWKLEDDGELVHVGKFSVGRAPR